MGWIATVTNKGYALQAKLLSTDKLNITRVVSGAGSCATTQLINQTAVTDIKQELIIDGLSYDKYDNARLKVTLNNINVTTSYGVSQIGIYATDPDEGEILYAIAQADEAEIVPSITEQPNGYYCSWDFSLTYSNAQNVNVTIDPSNAISQEEADKRYIQISKIGDNLTVDEDGTLSADAQEITVDSSLSSTSENPVQNKAVYSALDGKVDKVSGKGLSTNDYTTTEKNKLAGIATGANKYSLPTASASTLGGVKVGSGLTISNGVLSATGTDVAIDNALSSSSTNPVQNKVVNEALSGKASTNHTHDNATQWASGFMSNSDKQRLDGIQDRANNYSLPTASASTLGGVKVGSGLTISNGVLSATGTDVTIDNALSSSSTNPVQNKVVNSALGTKVDKETGKGLSTNDYTTTEKNKLAGIAEGANAYTHPAYTAKESALYKVTVDNTGHISGTTPVTKSDITDLGIPSKDTTYSEATLSLPGLMSAADKQKLEGIAEGANKYTHPSYTSKSSALYRVTVDSTGHVSGTSAVQKSDITALGIPSSDTKNTAGATNTSSKIFLIGATLQDTNPQTYSHDTAYVGTDGCLYSGGTKVSVEGHTHDVESSFSLVGYVHDGDWDVKEPTASDANVLNGFKAAILLGYKNKCVYESDTGQTETCLAVGYENEVYSDAVAFGNGLKSWRHQTVVGSYNKFTGDGNDKFIVGGGLTESGRLNLFRASSYTSKCYGVNAFVSSGADYAEYLEWEDGNPNNEDRRGRMVAYALTDVECTVEDVEILHPDTHELITVKAVVYEKMPPIRYANSFDECIGVVSGSASFIGNSASEDWNGKFLKDIYGENIKQAVLIPEETKTYKVKETDEKTGEEVIVEKTEVIPEHWVKQFVLNPHYDPEKEYISREFRQEWDPIGMVGMVVVEDDGTCVVGGYCTPSANGRGTAAETGYRVLQRIDNTHVRVLVK